MTNARQETQAASMDDAEKTHLGLGIGTPAASSSPPRTGPPGTNPHRTAGGMKPHAPGAARRVTHCQ